MKWKILFAAVLLTVSTTAAVEGYNGSEDRPHIMGGSGSSASATTAVGPNGTEWTSSVKMKGKNPDVSIGEKVENVTFTGNKTGFSGYIQAPTLCHVIDQETEKIGEESYRINIQTVKENQDGMCAQQVVMIQYKGDFRAETPYTLEISHDNQTIRTLENTADEGSETDGKEQDGSILSSFLEWLESVL